MPGALPGVVKTIRRSSKCGCNASFQWNFVTGELVFRDHSATSAHHPSCEPLSDTAIANRARIFRGTLSPSKVIEQISTVKDMLNGDYSIRPCQVRNVLNGKLRADAKERNNGIVDEKGVAFIAPNAYSRRIINAVRNKINQNVVSGDSLKALIADLELKGIQYSILYSRDEQGGQIVEAISFHDPTLADMSYECSVYTADVTFGITILRKKITITRGKLFIKNETKRQ